MSLSQMAILNIFFFVKRDKILCIIKIKNNYLPLRPTKLYPLVQSILLISVYIIQSVSYIIWFLKYLECISPKFITYRNCFQNVILDKYSNKNFKNLIFDILWKYIRIIGPFVLSAKLNKHITILGSCNTIFSEV